MGETHKKIKNLNTHEYRNERRSLIYGRGVGRGRGGEWLKNLSLSGKMVRTEGRKEFLIL